MALHTFSKGPLGLIKYYTATHTNLNNVCSKGLAKAYFENQWCGDEYVLFSHAKLLCGHLSFQTECNTVHQLTFALTLKADHCSFNLLYTIIDPLPPVAVWTASQETPGSSYPMTGVSTHEGKKGSGYHLFSWQQGLSNSEWCCRNGTPS